MRRRQRGRRHLTPSRSRYGGAWPSLVRREHLYFRRTIASEREVAALAKLQHPGIVPVQGGRSRRASRGSRWSIDGASLDQVINTSPAAIRRTQARPTCARAVLAIVTAPRTPTCRNVADRPPRAVAGPGRRASGRSAAAHRSRRRWPRSTRTNGWRAASHVKPNNVMLTLDGRAVAGNFGRHSPMARRWLTKSGSQARLDPAYMSPNRCAAMYKRLDAGAPTSLLGVTLTSC